MALSVVYVPLLRFVLIIIQTGSLSIGELFGGSCLSLLCCLPFFFYPVFLSVHPTFPGKEPEKTLDLDGALAFRLHSSMGVVVGVEEVDGGSCVHFKEGGLFMWKTHL